MGLAIRHGDGTTLLLVGRTVSSRHMPNIDPIAHAWRYCNPGVPLPFALAPRAGSLGLALGQPRPELSGTAQEAQTGLRAIACLPIISPADEAAGDSAGQPTSETAAGADDPPKSPSP